MHCFNRHWRNLLCNWWTGGQGEWLVIQAALGPEVDSQQGVCAQHSTTRHAWREFPSGGSSGHGNHFWGWITVQPAEVGEAMDGEGMRETRVILQIWAMAGSVLEPWNPTMHSQDSSCWAGLDWAEIFLLSPTSSFSMKNINVLKTVVPLYVLNHWESERKSKVRRKNFIEPPQCMFK